MSSFKRVQKMRIKVEGCFEAIANAAKFLKNNL